MEHQNRTEHHNRRHGGWVELHDLVCPGCDEQVTDRADGFTHADGSPLCAGEPMEVAR